MTVKTTILKDVAIVIPAITVWTGAKKLEPSDFINIDKHDLPSNRVASLGIKHLIDKERLTPFRSVRSKIDRLCASYGTRLMGGFAIPLDVVAKVSCELSDLCREFEDEIDKFIGQYDEAINDWIQQNPDFEVPLRRAMLSSNEVRRRFHADFAIFEVSASEMDKSNSLERVSDSLLTSVLNDAAKVMVALSGRSSKPTYYREAAVSSFGSCPAN